MSKPDISKTFTYPIFGYNLRVTITPEVGILARNLYPELPASQTADNVDGIHVLYGSHRSHIILPYGAEIGTIVHEVYHFCWRLMETIDALHENEIIAYHMGYTVQRICEWLSKVDPVPIVENKVNIGVDKVANVS